MFVPRMTLLGRVTPPEMSKRAPLPEAMVTSPVPKAPEELAWTLKVLAAAPPVIKVPPE